MAYTLTPVRLVVVKPQASSTRIHFLTLAATSRASVAEQAMVVTEYDVLSGYELFQICSTAARLDPWMPASHALFQVVEN